MLHSGSGVRGRGPLSSRPRMPAPAQILLVEDKDSLRAMLRHALERQGHAVLEARDQPEAVKLLQETQPALVLSDLRLPEGDGFGVLRASKEIDADVPVIVMTAYGSIEDAVTAMKEGALDFLAKPVDPDHLLLLVGRALEQRRLVTENLLMKEELARPPRRAAARRRGSAFRKMFASLQRAAGDRHDRAARGRERHRQGTVRAVAARAQPARRGAVCRDQLRRDSGDAARDRVVRSREGGVHRTRHARKPGKFEMAHRGTLFLDEIGDLPLALQAKILRALEERRFERVGGTALVSVDVRLVAATNRGLRAAVAARRFREDLFFRLSVFPITVPPLRDRGGDIPLLARYFVDRFCRELKKRPLTLSPSRRSSSCRPTAGRATSASSRTASSARSSSPTATRSCRATSICRSSIAVPRGGGDQPLGARRHDRHAERRHPAGGRRSREAEDRRGASRGGGQQGPGGGAAADQLQGALIAKLKEHGIE